MGFLDRIFGKVPAGAEDAIAVRYMRYADRIDLAGQNIIGLSGATKDDARRMIPFLVDRDQMQEKFVPESEATATMISEIADEIHDLTRATQGRGAMPSFTWACRITLKPRSKLDLATHRKELSIRVAAC